MSITFEESANTADIYRIQGNEAIRIRHQTNRFAIKDKVFPKEIPRKAVVCTQMSLEWKELLEETLEIKTDIYHHDSKFLWECGVPKDFAGSAAAVYQCIPIPLKCIVQGYYIPETKSWNQYKNFSGLKKSEKLPYPIYIPSTKSVSGKDDINISFNETIDILSDFIKERVDLIDGTDLYQAAREIAEEVQKASLDAYNFAYNFALERGIIIADTKLEFGLWKDENGKYTLVLINEAFTPETSKFWDVNTYKIGDLQSCIDKKYLYWYVFDRLCWDGISNPPILPSNVLNEISNVYSNIYYKLFKIDIDKVVDQLFQQWLGYTRAQDIF